MTEAVQRRTEWLVVLGSCVLLSATALAWSRQCGAMMNYGDAIAHMHIARRLFDSHRPGLTQLGSVWLPLPHLLMVPFVAVYSWWVNGLAGAIPSALAYLTSCIGLWRLARHWLERTEAALALLLFASNPNLLYLQTTAMTEPLFLCELVWAAVWAVEWREALRVRQVNSTGLLVRITAVLVAAVFTRYDGWILAFLVWVAIGCELLRADKLRSWTFWIASIAVVAAPLLWLGYNAAVFGDWLDFARGPYSARAIELRTAAPGGSPHPGWHNMRLSLAYFIKCVEIDTFARRWGACLFAASGLGTLWGLVAARRQSAAWALLLWIPLPFYAYSVAYGSVPIFIPVWWPHSWYNTRYGLELLPAVALGLGFAAQCAFTLLRARRPPWTFAVACALTATVAANSIAVLRDRPLTYVEGIKNMEARLPFDQAIPPALREALSAHPGELLVNTSVYPELIALTGIPLRQTVNESDKQFYRAALAAPAEHVSAALAFAGDEVDAAMHAHPQGFTAVRRFSAEGQPAATLYVRDARSPEAGSSVGAR